MPAPFAPLDPTSVAFMVAENRTMPMHVAALQIFRKPPGAGEDYVRSVYEQMVAVREIEPLFLKRPHRSARTAGQWTWVPDEQFDIEYHVRHNALPRPGRIRELLELCSRLQGQRLSRERPLWEAHVIEGLPDEQFALYVKMHHALADGVAAVRLLRSMLTDDPERRDVPVLWEKRPHEERTARSGGSAGITGQAIRAARSLTADAVGMPAALGRTLIGSLRSETSAVSLNAPRTMFNTTITGSRRFAAQGWPMQRLRAVAGATGTTLNDVVLAMCSGAVRDYLLDHDALPDQTLVSMVPVSLKARDAQEASSEGGNSVGAVMVQLGTHLADPADRLAAVHRSMLEGKQTLGTMTPTQIIAMSAIGMAPVIINPALRVQELVRPPFNLIISNVPGPRETMYFNGAELMGIYPLSIPVQGMALNITCASYGGESGDMDFGLVGCRRTVPHLQRLLTGLDTELGRLETAAAVG